MQSIWQENSIRRQFASLEKDIKTQVLIIGGGVAGILCAYTLQQAGVDCVLAEADRICNGVTANTTAKITLQHGLIYDKIIKEYGVQAATMYANAQKAALERFELLCRDVDCDYKTQDAYVYSRDNRAAIEQEMRAYERVGIAGEFCEKADVPIDIAGAVRVTKQAQFHPVKFCLSLAEGLRIYENTKIIEIIDGGAITKKGTVFADKIIVATHFPFANKYGAYFLKMYQHRSYVLALKNAPLPNGMYVDADVRGLSFRESDGLLLLGGGSHRTGKKGGGWQGLRDFAGEHYPRCQEAAYWATQDCMTLDGIPYIGQYSRTLPDVYVATGFNKWGMTSAMAAASILTDMIQGKENAYARVFSPSRRIWHPQLAVNMAETTLHWITPTVPRCPHLGCALKYNAHEHSWDCPCHGSRFTKDGKLIENPATDDLPTQKM